MSSLDLLYRDYPGDQAWRDFAAYYKSGLTDQDREVADRLLPGDVELAQTVIGILGRQGAEEWITYRSGVLDHLSPCEVIASRFDGVRIVRHALMRSPV